MEKGCILRNLTDVNEIRQALDAVMYEITEGIVQSGPFSGMKVLRDTSWRDTRLTPMLLGCYEEELHGAFYVQVSRLRREPNPKVAVIGCAEGYYAVGLKRLLPNATVYAVDIDEKAIEICQKAAAANDVEVVVGTPIDDILGTADFLFLDCEGSELFYLDTKRYRRVSSINILLEVHNLIETEDHPGIHTDEIIYERFQTSHHINVIFEGQRNVAKYSMLRGLPDTYRWLAMSENRPMQMCWYSMEPKGFALS